MKIAFIHYHLKTGGVTTCLRQQLEALKEDCQMCVVTGELPSTSFPANIIHLPQLAYSSVYRKSFDPEDVAAVLIDEIQTQFDGTCDLIHVHNPLLAKNTQFLKILKALQAKGLNLLLQVHDFAEDGRARLYFKEEYPENCHYCVVNSRDYQILLKSGLKKQGLHPLFNCVKLPQVPPEPVAEEPCVVYPIRAIRRKNIGEAILLSLLFADEANLSITLPPNSSTDIASYEGWKEFAADQRLQVEFDSGLDKPFEAIVCAARYLLTTSITEGFGFSFLEPWLFNKFVVGRKLPDICMDFESHGVDLDHMYTHLMVPIEGFDSAAFYDQWRRTVKQAARVFGHQIPPATIQNAYRANTRGGAIDFGLLSERYQKQLLQHLRSKRAHIDRLLTRNPQLLDIGRTGAQQKIIESNRNAVAANYHLAQYRINILNLYAQVIATGIRHRIDKQQLLAEFFDLKRFSLLKWGVDK
ncbi:MAG: hypothetical protein R3274_09700 [Desulfobacterales bacterium]|nr:hypothetical protein [Desulfobacterales bacterium]